MKFNIPSPDDISAASNGELTCFRILWPNTREWRAILGGLLWLMARGRTWNETTGSVRDVQTAGYRLFGLNYPLTECNHTADGDNGGRDCSGGGDCLGSGILVEGEDDMGQVVTDVAIVEGKLRVYFGPCCWKDLGDATDLKDTTDLSEQLPEEYQPENYAGDISCQKAHAMTVHLWRMAELLCQTPTFDEGMGSDLKSAYADISFDQLDLIGAYLGWVASEILFLGWSVNDTDFKTIRCKLNAVFTDRWSITSDEFKAMKAVVDGNLSLEKAAIFHGIIDAVGPGDWNKLALQSAMTAQSVDCLCPDQEFSPVYDFPTGTTWAYLFDFAVDDYSEWWSIYDQQANEAYVPGVGYKMTDVPYDLSVLQLDAYCTDEDNTTGLNYIKVFLDERPSGGTEVRWGNMVHVNSVERNQDLALPMALAWEYRAPAPGIGYPFESVFLYRSYTIKGEHNVSGNMVIRAVVLSGVGTPPMAGAPTILS